MAVVIVIKQPVKKGMFSHFGVSKPKSLTLSNLKKIVGEQYEYGHRENSNYSFRPYNNEDITDVDIVIYNPIKRGRGIICCVNQKGDVELYLNVPTTSHDVELFFEITKKICNHFNVTNFMLDEKLVDCKNIETEKAAIIKWNIGTINDYFAKIQDNTFIMLGACTPIYIEDEFLQKINNTSGEAQEELLANYINDKQQLDYFYPAPSFYKNDKKIIAVYSITEGVDTIIPDEVYIPFNSGLEEDTTISQWLVGLVGENNQNYDVVGYITYTDFLNNLPINELPRYDAKHYLMKGLTKAQIEKLLQYKVEL